MPKVESTKFGRVSLRPINPPKQQANATAGSFGGGQARDLQNLGSAIGNLANEVQKQAIISEDRKSKAIVRDTLNEARREARVFMADVYRLKGKDAVDAHALTATKMEELRRKYAKGLQNPRYRELFDSSFNSVLNTYEEKAFSIQEQERLNYEKETRDAENFDAIETAIINSNDPRVIKDSEFTIKANTRANYKGLGQTVIAQKEQEAIHTLHKSVLDSISSQDPTAGLEYFKTNMEKFNPASRAVLEKALKEQSDLFEVRQTAQEYELQNMSFEDQIAEVDKIKDPEKAKALKTEIEERFRLKDKIKERQEKDSEQSYWKEIKQGSDVLPYNKVPPDVLKAMVAYKRAQTKGFATQSSPEALQTLATLDDEDLLRIPLNKMIEYGDILTQEHFDTLFDRYLDLRNDQRGEKQPALIQLRSESVMLDKALNDYYGIEDPDDPKGNFFGFGVGKKKKQVEAAYNLFQNALNEYQISYGKKPSPQEQQKMLDELFISGAVDQAVNKKAPKKSKRITRAQVDAFDASEIPASELPLIYDALTQLGREHTPENVKQLYLDHKARTSNGE